MVHFRFEVTKMSWRTVEIITLAAIQTVIVNVLLLGPLAFRPALHWLLLAASFAVGLVLLKRSKGARCVTMLLVPQFLSKRGRAALIGYIFLLTLTGPTANTMVNVEVLGETLSCTQEQLKAAIRDTISALKVPFLAMKKIIDELLKTVERSFMKVQRIMMEMLKLVKRICEYFFPPRWFVAKRSTLVFSDHVSALDQKSIRLAAGYRFRV